MVLLEEMESEPELIYELIITIIDMLSIIANITLIITIVRAKTMRTRTNLYILNISVADLVTLSVLLLYYVDKRVLFYSINQDNYKHIQCFLTNLEITLQIVTVIFVIILVCNTLFNYKCLSQGLLILLMWNCIIIVFYLNVQYCEEKFTFIQAGAYAVSISILLLILCAKYCLRCKNKGDITRDGTFRLNFATIFISLCITSWAVNLIAEFCLKNHKIFKHFVLAFGTSIKVGKNIALSFYLFKCNDMFKESCMGFFNCKTITINEHVDYSRNQVAVNLGTLREDKHIKGHYVRK